jgi:hypothetical protein
MAGLMLFRPLPRPSAGTVARFAFEITTITIGILIALWIDGVKETRRDDALVRTAREQLTREIADNLRDVENTEPSRDAHSGALIQALQLVDALRASRTSVGPTSLGLSSPSFPRSAWDTAGRTGVLALMEYDEVKAFSEIYDLQELVDRAQESYVRRLTQDSSQFMAVVAKELGGAQPDRADLDAARTQGMALVGAFRFYRELMQQLASQYKVAKTR